MADLGNLKVKFSLDTSQFSHSMSDINRNLRGLKSEMNVAKAGGVDFQKSLDGLRNKSDILTRTFDVQKAKVSELKRQYDDSVKATGNNSKETENLAKRYNDAVAAMGRTEQQLKEVTDQIKKQTDPWHKLSSKLDEAGDKFTKFGEKAGAVGKELTMKVTAPIVGIGALMVKTGIDFEASMSNVAAISGATGGDLEKLEEKAREMGATTSKSASESADALGYMALAGWDTQQMLEGIEPVLRLSEAANLDLARASDLVTDSMSALGIEVEDLPGYLDMMAQASRKSNTTVDALMEAFLVAGGTLSSFNVPLEESAAILGILANRGLKGSEAGTALNAIFTNLTSGAGAAGKAMEKLGVSAFDSEGNFKGLEAVLLEVKNKTKDMTEEQQASFISAIAGKEHLKSFQGIMAGLGAEYGDLKEDIVASDGALNDMASTMQDNAKGNISAMKSAFEELSISFSTYLLPSVTKGIQFLTDLAQKFGEMEPEKKKLIVGFAAVAAAVGPMVLGVAKIATTIGMAMPLISAISTAIAGAGGLSAALVAISGPVGIAVAAVAALGAIGYTAYKGIKHATSDSIDEVDLFSDKVSESTQKAVGSFMELHDEAVVSLNQLNWSSSKITEEMAEDLVSKFQGMNEQIVVGLREKKDEALGIYQELFSKSKGISEEEQQAILESIENGYENRIVKTEEGTARIEEIYQTAANNNREITQKEMEEVEQIRQAMLDEALVVLTENEREQKVILERMQLQASEITARQAADVVKNSVQQKDLVVAEAEDQFSKIIAETIRQRDETGEITAEQAEQIISEARRQRDEVVFNAEEMHKRVVEEAKLQAGEHVQQVNWQTGEILKKWEVFTRDMIMKTARMSVEGKQKWNEFSTGVETAVGIMKDRAVKRFAEIAAEAGRKFIEAKNNIMNPIRDAKEKVSGFIAEIKGFFTNLRLKIPKPEMPRLPKFSLATSTKSILGKDITYPTGFHVNWNAKGAYFDRPVVFNSPYGLQGFGEAGGEIAMPAEGKHMHPFADAVFERLAKHFGTGEGKSQSVTNIFNVEGNLDSELYDELMEKQAREMDRSMYLNGMRKIL